MENFDPLAFGQHVIESKRSGVVTSYHSSAEELMSLMEDNNLYLYPYGQNARQLRGNLENSGFSVLGVFDRVAMDNHSDFIRPPSDIRLLEETKSIVIVCSNFKTVRDEAFDYIRDVNPRMRVIDGQSLNRLLRAEACVRKLNSGSAFDVVDCERCGYERNPCTILDARLKAQSGHTPDPEKKSAEKFDWTGYIVSQKCTLKCEHCCEHVPYLDGKGFSSVEEIIQDVTAIAESAYFLRFVELVGGEPLLHPKIEDLLSGLLQIKNIGYIKSFTNATVVPSDRLCEIMKNERFMLQVSNYESVTSGKMLEQIIKTKEKLRAYDINYVYSNDFTWLDFNSFDHHDATLEHLKEGFDKCFLKNCHRVYKGKIYRCPHQYAGDQTGKLPAVNEEIVSFRGVGRVDLTSSLAEFEELSLISTCAHCELAFSPNVVPAGLQLSSGKPKRMINITKLAESGSINE